MNFKSGLFLLGAIFLLCNRGFAFEMTKIPAGKLNQFWLTPVSNNDELAKLSKTQVEVPGFSSMIHAVTYSQFKKFIQDNPKWSKENISQLFADATYLDSDALSNLKEDSPITNVSWFAANQFCRHYEMRLPTVVEWEYMAAASENEKDANKDEKFLRRILDWYGEPREGKLKSVKHIYKNMYGLWDMHGLIWEWVYDFNSTFVTGESREDTSFNKNLFCGAGAMSSADKENYAAFMRFAFRSSLKGRSSAWNLGFRCVR